MSRNLSAIWTRHDELHAALGRLRDFADGACYGVSIGDVLKALATVQLEIVSHVVAIEDAIVHLSSQRHAVVETRSSRPPRPVDPYTGLPLDGAEVQR